MRLFEEAYAQLAQWADADSPEQYQFRISGLEFCLRSSCAATLRVVAAPLLHRACAQEKRPDFVPHTAVTVIPHERVDDKLRQHLPYLAQPRRTDGGERWYRETEDYYGLLHEGFGILYMLEKGGGRGGLWLLNSTDPIPYVVRTSPLLPLFHWIFSERGYQIVHAAAITDDRAAILVTGRGGAGKSTAALACLQAGLGYLGDDMVMVGPVGTDAPIRVHSLFCTAKLERNAIHQFPGLAESVVPAAGQRDDKEILLLERRFADQLVLDRPLLAGVVPSRAMRGFSAACARLASAQAFLHLAPNVLLQLPGKRDTSTKRLRHIASTLPFYAVDVGTPSETPERIRQFISTLTPE